MLSKLGEDSTELDVFAAKAVPGTMYIAGTDTVSASEKGPRNFSDSLIDCLCPGDIHPSNDVVS